MRMRKTTRFRRGETLVETLTAILIMSLASVTLAAMIGSSAKLNTATKESDRELYAAISAIETQSSPTSGRVTVTIGDTSVKTVNFNVNFFTDSQEVLSAYKYDGGS